MVGSLNIAIAMGNPFKWWMQISCCAQTHGRAHTVDRSVPAGVVGVAVINRSLETPQSATRCSFHHVQRANRAVCNVIMSLRTAVPVMSLFTVTERARRSFKKKRYDWLTDRWRCDRCCRYRSVCFTGLSMSFCSV